MILSKKKIIKNHNIIRAKNVYLGIPGLKPLSCRTQSVGIFRITPTIFEL